MNELYEYQGATYNVGSSRLQEFLSKFPGATKVDEPGKQIDSSIEAPTTESNVMGSELVDGSLEQPEITPWQNFKNNISNAFEMISDGPEFYGIGTEDKSVEEVAKEGDAGAYSGLNIATTLIYESVFGKDKMKEMVEKNPNFFKNINTSDSKQFQNIIENFEKHIDSKDPANNCLDVAIITAPEKRTQKTKDKLKTVAGRALNK